VLEYFVIVIVTVIVAVDDRAGHHRTDCNHNHSDHDNSAADGSCDFRRNGDRAAEHRSSGG